MKDRLSILEHIKRSKIIVIVRGGEINNLDKAICALSREGLHTFEVTMTTPGALASIEALRAKHEDLLVGAGTILDSETARAVLLAGAQFVVSPTLNREVIETTHRYDVVAIPGAFTPTEALRAWEAGADIVKIFPASVVGPEYIKALRGPLPQIRLLPTGGIDLDNVEAFFEAGAFALAMGGSLLDHRSLKTGDYTAVIQKGKRLRALLANLD